MDENVAMLAIRRLNGLFFGGYQLAVGILLESFHPKAIRC
jgi:hypothetical protein